MDAVQRTQIFLLATLSAVACGVYRVNLCVTSVTCTKKTLLSFWPFPSFRCRALAEVMTKSSSHSMVESVFECLQEKF